MICCSPSTVYIPSWMSIRFATYRATGTGLAPSITSTLDGNNTATQLTLADESAGYGYHRFEEHRPSETKMLGFNTDWQISDSLHVNIDLSRSEAVQDNDGLNSRQTVEMIYQPGYTLSNAGGDYPTVTSNDPAAVAVNSANRSKLFPRHQEQYGDYIESENDLAKFDFGWDTELGALTKVNFGAHFSSKTKANDKYQTPQNINGVNLVKIYQGWGENLAQANSLTR